MKTRPRRWEAKTGGNGFAPVEKVSAKPGRSSVSGSPVTCVGKLTGFSKTGLPLVEYTARSGIASPGSIAARTTVPLHKSQIGCEVVLLLAGANATEPIVMGCILPAAPPAETAASQAASLNVELNGKRLELTAEEEIVLRCGNASITLTKAGKVLIRGAYLLSRSAGVNRIKGGSVQIN